MTVLLLGVHVEERDMWGGIIQLSGCPPTVQQKIRDAIAESQGQVGPPTIGLSPSDLRDFAFSPIPFSGTVDHEILVYIE